MFFALVPTPAPRLRTYGMLPCCVFPLRYGHVVGASQRSGPEHGLWPVVHFLVLFASGSCSASTSFVQRIAPQLLARRGKSFPGVREVVATALSGSGGPGLGPLPCLCL